MDPDAGVVDRHDGAGPEFRRVESGWLLTEVGPDGALLLEALGCELPLAEIYERAEEYPSDEEG